MSKGGYTSVPIVLAAAFLRIPIVIHESDAVMGRANRIATCFARYVITAYEETSTTFLHPVVLVLGIPVRRSLLSERGEQALATFAISPTRPVLLVLGGSQGAERINQFILDTLDELLTDFTIIHQTGIKNLEICKLSADRLITDIPQRNEYHPVGFLDSTMLNDAYHRADIVISRAGSNSIYEIALHGKPAILIPIPEEVSHDQRTNAYTYARTGAAIVMEEKNLTDNLLRAEIDRMMQSEVYDQMVRAAQSFGKRDAGERIAELLMSIAKEHKT